MASSLRNFLRRGLVQNILALYGAHFGSYLLPLVTVPYLTRVLGPEKWGLVAIAQAFGWSLSAVAEYGFELSATRAVSRNRDSPARLGELLVSVTCAKVLLAIGTIGLAFAAAGWMPAFQAWRLLFWAAVFEALARAMSPFWYFLGRERMRLVAVLDISVRLTAACGIFLTVRGPADLWKVPAAYGVGWCLAFLVCATLACRGLPLPLPRFGPIFAVLREGWGIFLFQFGSTFYTTGNAFILGLFTTPLFVGYFAGAERIIRALLGLLAPVSRALYPRFSHLVQTDRALATQWVRYVVGTVAALGFALALGTFIFAPWIVKLILGGGFGPAVAALRILAVLLPIIAVNNVLGYQWMLPHGMDYSFAACIYAGAAANLLVAAVLAPRYDHLGMSCAVLVAECVVLAAMCALIRRRGLDPL